MSGEKTKTALKIILRSGREVIIFSPKQSDLNESARLAGMKAKAENQIHTGILLQQELLKRLIHSVNGKELTLAEKQDSDIFSIQENAELSAHISNLTGSDLGNLAEAEVITVN